MSSRCTSFKCLLTKLQPQPQNSIVRACSASQLRPFSVPDTPSSPASRKLQLQLQATAMEPWPEDSCIRDMDDFVKALTTFRSKGVQPELIGSIIAHYASKWLPQFSETKSSETTSPTSSWMKKRFFVQTLVDFLPQEHLSIPCAFLLKLLKAANMIGLEPSYLSQIEQRVAFQLDQATIKDLMIPSFNHTCATLLDIELVHRLAQIFVEINESANKSGSALAKVAKLLDSYLAEAAMDAKLTLTQFIDLASALPQHARATHDGLYRAIDTYLKAHQEVSKQERRTLCSIIDSQKLSQEAAIHAAQNERLPVRSVIQVIFSEQTKMSNQLEWGGSFSWARSPMPVALEPATRCHSKRVASMSPEQVEMRRLREEVGKLQSQCSLLQEKMDRMMEKQKGGLKWKKFSLLPSFKGKSDEKVEDEGGQKKGEVGTRMVIRGSRTPRPWRNSLS